MKTKLQLSDIPGYPEIIPHIVDVSDLLDICLGKSVSYGFTIIMDDISCVNVFFDAAGKEAWDLIRSIKRLREKLINEVKLASPGFVPFHLLHTTENSSAKKEIDLSVATKL